MTPAQRRLKNVLLTSILFLVLIGGGILGVLTLSKKGGAPEFDIRKSASITTGDVIITYETSATDRYVGDQFPVTIKMNTQNRAINSVGFRMVFTPTAGTPELDVIDENPTTAGVQFQTSTIEGLDVQLVSVEKQPNGQMHINYSAFAKTDPNTGRSEFKNNEAIEIAHVKFKAGKPASNFQVSHDGSASQAIAMVEGVPVDVLRSIAPLTLNIITDNQPPVVNFVRDLPRTAPVETFLPEIEQGTVSTNSAQTFSWKGNDLPQRPEDTQADLTYGFMLDSAWVYTPFTDPKTFHTINFTPAQHGQHIVRIYAKDKFGQQSLIKAGGSEFTFTLNLTPKILAIDLLKGTSLRQVTITGYNFGPTKATVLFGTVAVPAADIISWTRDKIVVKAPVGKGPIKVKVGTLESKETNFVYDLDTMLVVYYVPEGLPANTAPTKIGLNANGVSVADVLVKKGTTEVAFDNVTATWNTTEKAYEVLVGPLMKPFTTAADYVVLVSEQGRLAKKYSTITLYEGLVNVVRKISAADALPMLDLNDDNTFDLKDYGLFIDQFRSAGSLSVTLTSANLATLTKFDFNRDGKIDIGDVVLFKKSYRQLQKPGDNK
ncbi:MAG TPA: IPT/TIG domain-containing protein [Patescibacteria group bacterium]|nr:IPT/TIG domain-containing protein [Patescibacteria group bacterium]